MKALPRFEIRHVLWAAMWGGACIALGGGCPLQNEKSTHSVTVSSAPSVSKAKAENTASGTQANDAANSKKPEAVGLKLLSYDELQSLIASHRGKVVVVDIWSTSCPPCVAEFPHLVELSRTVPTADLACVSVALEYQGAKGEKPEDHQENVLAFLKEKRAAFDNVLAKEDSDTMHTKLKITAPPVVFVYARDGTLAKRFDNDNAKNESEAFHYDQVGALVRSLLTK